MPKCRIICVKLNYQCLAVYLENGIIGFIFKKYQYLHKIVICDHKITVLKIISVDLY